MVHASPTQFVQVDKCVISASASAPSMSVSTTPWKAWKTTDIFQAKIDFWYCLHINLLFSDTHSGSVITYHQLKSMTQTCCATMVLCLVNRKRWLQVARDLNLYSLLQDGVGRIGQTDGFVAKFVDFWTKSARNTSISMVKRKLKMRVLVDGWRFLNLWVFPRFRDDFSFNFVSFLPRHVWAHLRSEVFRVDSGSEAQESTSTG